MKSLSIGQFVIYQLYTNKVAPKFLKIEKCAPVHLLTQAQWQLEHGSGVFPPHKRFILYDGGGGGRTPFLPWRWLEVAVAPSRLLHLPLAEFPAERCSTHFESPVKPLKTLNRDSSVFRSKVFMVKFEGFTYKREQLPTVFGALKGKINKWTAVEEGPGRYPSPLVPLGGWSFFTQGGAGPGRKMSTLLSHWVQVRQASAGVY